MAETDSADAEIGDLLRDWDARQYLDYYYAQPSLPDDEVMIFRFIANGLRDIGRRFEAGLELGCGPTLHHAAQLVPWVDRLDLADVQEPNLEEIRRWLRAEPGAFDWSVYLGGVLDAEAGRGGSLADREALLRARIQLARCDLREPYPLGAAVQYPLVASNYCIEWVIPDVAGWRATMRNVSSLVATGGWLFLVGVHATDYCMINGRRVPCAHITQDDVRGALVDLGFDDRTLRIEVIPAPLPAAWGIQGTFMARAQRSAACAGPDADPSVAARG
jgi:hypothetical protein